MKEEKKREGKVFIRLTFIHQMPTITEDSLINFETRDTEIISIDGRYYYVLKAELIIRGNKLLFG